MQLHLHKCKSILHKEQEIKQKKQPSGQKKFILTNFILFLQSRNLIFVRNKLHTMIVNDLQRLRWQILDECLRNTELEFFMGGPRDTETGNIRSLLAHVNRRLKKFNRTYKCSKRQLQLDVDLFERRGGRLEPRFRRGHKRILRYMNVNWTNPLLRQAKTLYPTTPSSGQTLSSLEAVEGAEPLVLHLRGKALEETGREIFAINTPVDDRLKQLLWSYRSDVEVLLPDELRQEMAREMQSLFALYTKLPNPIWIDEGMADLTLNEEPEEATDEATAPAAAENTNNEEQPTANAKHHGGEQLSLFGDLF